MPVEMSDQPWIKNHAWQTPEISSSSAARLKASWGICLFLWICTVPGLLAMPAEVRAGNYGILVILLFAIWGLWQLRDAVRRTGAWLRRGTLVMTMDPFPGAIAGHTGGVIRIPAADTAAATSANWRIRIRCTRNLRSVRRSRSSSRPVVLWEQSGHPDTQPDGPDLLLMFRFDVPKDLPESSTEQPRNIEWAVELTRDDQPRQLPEVFEIPVFATAARSHTISCDLSRQHLTEQEQQLAAEQNEFDRLGPRGWLSEHVGLQDDGQQLTLHWRIGRHAATAAFLLMFGASCAVPFWITADQPGSAVRWLFCSVFGVLGTVCVLSACWIFLNSLTVKMRDGRITTTRRLLGLPLYKTETQVTDVRRVLSTQTGSEGNGPRQVKYFRLSLQTSTRTEITIATGVRGALLAKRLRHYLSARLELDTRE